jgi:hypothetical protein
MLESKCFELGLYEWQSVDVNFHTYKHNAIIGHGKATFS